MKTKNKCSCIECKKEISICNIKKHYKSKSCITNTTHSTKFLNCPYCGLNLKQINKTCNIANHIRWCYKNPNRSNYINKQKHRQHSIETKNKISIAIKKLHTEGIYDNVYLTISNTSRKHSEKTKQLLSKLGRNNNYQRVCKHTHFFVDKNNRIFKFDSSWEDALAIRLDELNIFWTRPKPIQYIDHLNKNRNYFPDFYLPEYNLYLDPKNLWVQKQQTEKIKILKKHINLLILSSLDECKNFSI